MTSSDRILVAKQYLRRTYANNVDGLKALATTIANSAFEAVTITGNSYIGGNATGVLTFEPLEYLGAVEELIAELDPDSPQPAPTVVHSDFSCRPVVT